MPKANHNVVYFENIDVLRFVLALFVLLYHIPVISAGAGLPSFGDAPFLQKGLQAVYWFFVLSGFLLAYLAKKETDAGRFSIRKFITRRILRIWPVYFMVIFIGIGFYYFLVPYLNIPFENKAPLSTAVLLSVFFLSNILHRLYDPGGILTITWSVSVEEQFYLLFPFAVRFFFASRKLRVVSMTLLLALVWVVDLLWPAPKGWLDYFNMYFELFLVGIIAGELLPFFMCGSKRTKQNMMVLAVVVFILSFFTNLLHTGDHVTGRITSGMLGAFVILVLSSADKHIKSRWLIMGGKISYGMYMFHMIVITGIIFLVKTYAFNLSWQNQWMCIVAINLVTILLTYIVAYISYQTIEKYFLSKKPY